MPQDRGPQQGAHATHGLWRGPSIQGTMVDTRPTPDRSYNREDLDWQEETWNVSEDSRPGQLGYYLDLHGTICHGAPLAVTPESVRRVMWVLEECHELSPVWAARPSCGRQPTGGASR